MRVDIEKVRELQRERMKINSTAIEDIEWYEDGKKVEIDPKTLEDFKFTGLNNTDFIITEIYKIKKGINLFDASKCEDLLDEIVGENHCCIGYMVAGSTGLGPDPHLINAQEFVKRISKLQQDNLTKEECKNYFSDKLKERLRFGTDETYYNKSWPEWDCLIEAAFGNLQDTHPNPVVQQVIEIMKRKRKDE